MIKLNNILLLSLAFISVTFSYVHAQLPTSLSNRIYRASRAGVENPGTISIGGLGAFYLSGQLKYISIVDVTNNSENPYTYSLSDLGSSNIDVYADLNLSERFSLSLNVNILQVGNTPQYVGLNSIGKDTASYGFSFADYIRVSLKYAPLLLFKNRFQVAVFGGVNFTTKKRPNQILVPFIESTRSFWLGVVGSFYFGNQVHENYKKLLPSIHANYALSFLLDEGIDLSLSSSKRAILEDRFIINPTLHGKFAVGFEFPIRMILASLPSVFLGVEVSGIHAINRRLPHIVYSREDMIYLTGLIRIEPLPVLTVEFGGEYLVYGNHEDITDYNEGVKGYNIRQLSADNYNYPPFRIFGSLQFNIPYVNPPFYTADADIYKGDIDHVEDYETSRYDLIFKALSYNSSNIRRLYGQAKQVDTTISGGEITLHLKISKSGRAVEIDILHSTFYPSDAVLNLENSIIEEMRRWKYPTGRTPLVIRFVKLKFLKEGELYVSG